MREPGGAGEDIRAGASGEKPREVSGWGNVPNSGQAWDLRQMEKSGKSWIGEGKGPQHFDRPPPPQPCTTRLE